jgi:hypothetical protein
MDNKTYVGSTDIYTERFRTNANTRAANANTTYVTRRANSLRHEYGGNRERVGVTEGELRGTKAVTESGTTYCSFEDIPYARPPLKSLRFRVSAQGKIAGTK